MKLPTWLEANRNVANKTANPIDVFIDNNEPAGLESEEKFREELEKMLEYVRLLTQPAPDAGESVPLQALSTPEHSATSQNLSTPASAGKANRWKATLLERSRNAKVCEN